MPLEVINDGEVTALAGMLSLGERAMLGVAMGSSQAGGFLNAEGHITGWLDELAFAPVDASPGRGRGRMVRRPGRRGQLFLPAGRQQAGPRPRASISRRPSGSPSG